MIQVDTNYQKYLSLAQAGCYQKNITYISGSSGRAVSMYQIESLIELAAYCEQEIHYDCTLAPLSNQNVNFAFWEDRQGEKNIYYTGINSPRKVFKKSFATRECGLQRPQL